MSHISLVGRSAQSRRAARVGATIGVLAVVIAASLLPAQRAAAAAAATMSAHNQQRQSQQQPLTPTADDPPPAPETSFDFAVVPDTQNEVLVDGAPQLTARYQWLADNRAALNLKFIAHIGDVTNWGVADPTQFARASAATSILDASGIPFANAIGNHDGAAVKVGGSAAPGNVRDNLRVTTVFNQYFPLSRFAGVQGTYEPNKVDNMYQTFTAGGLNWLVLTHEIWPRESVIQWMSGVVAAHPTYNVIVNTHAFTDQSGALPTTGTYGDQNALVEWNEFVSQYPNIKFVVSGHYGPDAPPIVNAGYSYTERAGVNGNKVALIMTAYHSSYQNHVRLLKIDTAAGTISSSVYVSKSTDAAHATGYITDGASNFVTTGMTWVQPDGTTPTPTPTPTQTAPSAPTAVTATAVSGQASVTFSTPASTGGSPITGYTVTGNPGGIVASGTVSPIVVGGLTNGVAYTFTVSATNAVGTSPPSVASAAVTPQAVGQPQELLPDPGFEAGVGGWKAFNVGTLTNVTTPRHGGSKALRVAAVSTTASLVGLTQNAVVSQSVLGRQYTAQCWVNPSGPGLNLTIRLLQYTQDFSVNTKLNTTTVATLPANTWTLVAVSGAATANGYRVIPQVYSSNETTATGSIIYDDCSTSITAAAPTVTPPGVPTAVTAVGEDGQATVSFTPPASDGGSAITGYTVTSSPDALSVSGSGSPITVGGLTNGTAYTFTVKATNAVGSSAASVPSPIATPSVPHTVPSQPLAVAAVAGDGQATVGFSAPTTDGGSPIASYLVTSSPGGFSATGTTTPITVGGLANGTAYSFTVTATNALGASAPSMPSDPVTPASTAPPATVPSAPGGVTAVGGDGQAVVSFTAPDSDGGSPVTGYTVTSSPGGLVTSGATSPITVGGLTNDTEYTFTVTATNLVGSSPDSDASAPVTPTAPVIVATVPLAPSSVVATGGDGRATVAFSPPLGDGGSPVTGYTVTSSPGGVVATGSSSPITVAGLVNGLSYTFTVTASNAIGGGAASIASAPVVPTAPPVVELLPDPGFEAGVGGWKAFNVGTLTSVTTPRHGGSRALKVTAVSGAASLVGLTQNAVVSQSVVGRQYTAQCWANATGANLNLTIRLLQYTQDFATNTKLGTTTVAALPANTWTLVQVKGVATASGYRVIPQVYSSNETTATGSIVYDDCSVTYN